MVLYDAWQFPTLAWGDPTLPSALRRFTSEFGMGSGGTTALVPPGKFFVRETNPGHRDRVGCARKLSHIPVYAPSFTSLAALSLHPVFRFCKFFCVLSRVFYFPARGHKAKSSGPQSAGQNQSVMNKLKFSHPLSQNASGVVRLSLTGH